MISYESTRWIWDGVPVRHYFWWCCGGHCRGDRRFESQRQSRPRQTEWSEEEEPLSFDTEEGMEMARRSLENKIAQLNGAIDDVRQQMTVLHPHNGQEPLNPNS